MEAEEGDRSSDLQASARSMYGFSLHCRRRSRGRRRGGEGGGGAATTATHRGLRGETTTGCVLHGSPVGEPCKDSIFLQVLVFPSDDKGGFFKAGADGECARVVVGEEVEIGRAHV